MPKGYERIYFDWPRLPEVSGESPLYTKRAIARLLPFSEKRPLLFHVLTTLGRPDEETEQRFMELAESGAALASRRDIERAEQPRSWGETPSMVFHLDRAAGDDRYVFTTPCNTFAKATHERGRDLAVAFDGSSIIRQHPTAFRVRDLDMLYHRVASAHGFKRYEDEDQKEGDGEGPIINEPDHDLIEDLRLAAQAGTQDQPRHARALLLIYARLLSAFRDRKYQRVLHEVRLDDPQRVAIYEAAAPHFPDWVSPIRTVEQETGAAIDAHHALGWNARFGQEGTIYGFPSLLMNTPADERPELLVEGRLRLADAVFYRDHEQRWLPLPAAVKRAGRLVANPSILIYGGKRLA